MIGVVLITHGRIAEALTEALELIVGKQPQWKTLAIDAADSLNSRRADVLRAIRDVDSGAGVIILTDMFGGTPSNLAISAMSTLPVEVLAGVNLPMLIKITQVRGRLTLAAAAIEAQEAARKYIHIASALMQETA